MSCINSPEARLKPNNLNGFSRRHILFRSASSRDADPVRHATFSPLTRPFSCLTFHRISMGHCGARLASPLDIDEQAVFFQFQVSMLSTNVSPAWLRIRIETNLN
jgi:hypothetical protein